MAAAVAEQQQARYNYDKDSKDRCHIKSLCSVKMCSQAWVDGNNAEKILKYTKKVNVHS